MHVSEHKENMLIYTFFVDFKFIYIYTYQLFIDLIYAFIKMRNK